MATPRKVGDQELMYLSYDEVNEMLDSNLKKGGPGTACARLCPLFETSKCIEAPCSQGVLTTKQTLITFKLTGVKL